MEASRAYPDVEFRFTDPDDVEKYGSHWRRYSELELINRPAKVLMDIEEELGLPLVDAMNGMRTRSMLGDTVISWIALRDEDLKLAGPFEDYNPRTMLMVWRPATEETEPGKGEGPASDESVPDPSGPLVTLQTSPIAE